MDTRSIEQVEGWETRSYAGGHSGLHDLADEDWSGVVRVGETWLFMLNGRVVDVLGGSIEDFDGSRGTAYTAPHPALPLLFAMLERDTDARGKYYTEDKPISETDEMLSDANFTGYVELSENVLSGDYYLVYHAGRSMSVALVGSSERLLTDDEAFERADNEVGLYEVREAEVDIIDIPEPTGHRGTPTDPRPEPEPARETGSDAEPEPAAAPDPDPGPATDAGPDTRTDTEPQGGTEPGGGSAPEPPEPERGPEPEPATDPPPATEASDTEPVESSERGSAQPPEEPDTARDPAVDEPAGASTEPADTTAETPREEVDAGMPRQDGPPRERQRTGDRQSGRPDDSGAGSQQATDPESPGGGSRVMDTHSKPTGPEEDDAGTAGTAQLETRSIPSLDPENSGAAGGARPAATRTGSDGGAEAGGRSARRSGNGRTSRESEPRPERTPGGSPGEGERQRPRTAREVDRLEERLEAVESERDDLAAERDRLRDTIERLESRVEELESRPAPEPDDAGGDTGPTGRGLTAEEAFAGTDLFVRYDSKEGPTLEDAHEGSADPEDVRENLALEVHTRFDAADVTVDGVPFDEFLPESVEYRFVDWFLGQFLQEIRETGNRSTLGALFDEIPRVDRVEFRGEVSLDEGESEEAVETFDLVFRDRMGDPLVVANVNDTRNPVSDETMAALVTAATNVADVHGSLTCAFQVTSSFFEPEAVDTAAEATGGGRLLSRESRKSFVKLSRKQGYHLCLVEARSGQFELAIPEL